MVSFKNDIKNCIATLKSGGLILYPTDTIWGIGCDATNDKAVEKIFSLKKRADKKAMIILVATEEEIYEHTKNPDKKIFKYLTGTDKPTTVIYEQARNISQRVISSDGTVGIRIVKDDFCRQLIFQYKKPIVSTSANVSGEPSPGTFDDIRPAIKNGVDYIVQHRQNDLEPSQASSIIKLNNEGEIEIIR